MQRQGKIREQPFESTSHATALLVNINGCIGPSKVVQSDSRVMATCVSDHFLSRGTIAHWSNAKGVKTVIPNGSCHKVLLGYI